MELSELRLLAGELTGLKVPGAGPTPAVSGQLGVANGILAYGSASPTPQWSVVTNMHSYAETILAEGPALYADFKTKSGPTSWKCVVPETKSLFYEYGQTGSTTSALTGESLRENDSSGKSAILTTDPKSTYISVRLSTLIGAQFTFGAIARIANSTVTGSLDMGAIACFDPDVNESYSFEPVYMLVFKNEPGDKLSLHLIEEASRAVRTTYLSTGANYSYGTNLRIVLVQDASTTKLYVNGTLAATGTRIPTNLYLVLLGARSDDYRRRWNGQISEVFLLKKAVSSEWVANFDSTAL